MEIKLILTFPLFFNSLALPLYGKRAPGKAADVRSSKVNIKIYKCGAVEELTSINIIINKILLRSFYQHARYSFP